MTRTTGGRFAPGQSGNPKGRPPGQTPKARLRASLDKAMPGILQTLIDQAKSGDSQAAIALLDRAIPKLRPESAPLALDISGTPDDLRQKIKGSLMAGDIAVEQAAELLALFAPAKEEELPMPHSTGASLEEVEMMLEEMTRRAFEEQARIRKERGIPHAEENPA